MIRRALGVLFGIITMVVVAGFTAPAGAASSSLAGARPPGYQAGGYGTLALVGGSARADTTAMSGIGCRSKLGDRATNTTGAQSRAPVVATGTTGSTASAIEVPGGTASRATSSANGLALLSGAIKAASVTALSRTADVGGTFSVTGGGQFSGLVVNGSQQGRTIPPNTKMRLPGIGYVIFNEQIARTSATGASLTVNMIHAVVNRATNQLPAGTTVIVGHAFSTMSAVSGPLGGHVYGTRVTVGAGPDPGDGSLWSGPTALLALACTGTDGHTVTSSVSRLTVPSALSVGTITDSARGTVTAVSATGETTSTANAVNVAKGLVTTDAVKADAHVIFDGATATFADAGTGFTGLRVKGHPEISDSVPVNTLISIPGLGKLWLRHEIKTGKSLEVRMIELIVDQTNSLGLPIGADIRVAVASAEAY